ncbi:phosphocholine-specific phospholipase C [Pedobacter sp. MW01-1-1]|uniref:phosphocholine-specific phospholipase C n=1 Tax=Pedobacter sp. MW01-1-1 TaxID=3383027 RepID=UPI003FEF6A40
MATRREFLKKSAMFASVAGATSVLPASVLKAMAISPDPGTTFYDAEHVVFLMQENRSFDHMFGTMKGVRGFNDPHPHIQPDGNKVWLQKSKDGKTFAPFHVDINKTKITWQGGLPHSWNDQVAARNNGKFDKWVPVKTPMTMAYYNRQDIPFYYALADAFTICDQHFCSSLTGTTPNRLFFFTGTVRGDKNQNKTAVVSNGQAESRNKTYVDWPTFQELLEDNGIDWRIYQNEIWTADLPGKGVDDWLGNYGDNPIEYVKRHQVKLASYFRKNGDKTANPQLTAAQVQEQYNRLSQREKNLIDKAFTTNEAEADYLALAPFTFTNDKGVEETINIPKGDVFHQFRKDVNEGKLPAVSWLVAPQKFSDHTSSPLYGTWYVSEALDILTQNPDVWKKTIFVLTYDENDGYFDHQPPFIVPNPADPESGNVSRGINFSPDFEPQKGSPIGLGYRVPLIVASPWSKGGYVNSQVFDHTSSLMFLEKWLKHKTGKTIKTTAISDWRREMCGDLTSIFRPYKGDEIPRAKAENREAIITSIGNARNKPAQSGPTALSADDIRKVNALQSFSTQNSPLMPHQEPGVKPSCALPYNLNVDAFVKDSLLEISFESAKLFGSKMESVGAPFTMYAANNYKGQSGKNWAYGVRAGDILTDRIELKHFEKDEYRLAVNGPNGFFRSFTGTKKHQNLKIKVAAGIGGLLVKKINESLVFTFENFGTEELSLIVTDNAYKKPEEKIVLKGKSKQSLTLNVASSGNWYDFSIRILNDEIFHHRYAGKIETGENTHTDPFMGNV